MLQKNNTGDTDWQDVYITADYGDTIYYRIVITGVDEITDLVLHDALPAGYSISGASALTIKLYSSSSDNDARTLTLGTDYTYSTNSSCSVADGCDFEIDFALLLAEDDSGDAYYDKVLSLTSNADEAFIEIIYAVTVDTTSSYIATNSVTDSAVANTNTAKIVSSGTTKADDASVYYFELYIYKYTTNSQGTEVPLDGAEFTLSYTEGTTTYYAVATEGDDGEYTFSRWTTDSSEATALTTNDSGIIHIIGLDKETYSITEIKAPDGYALISDPETAGITVTTNSQSGLIETVSVSGATSSVAYGSGTVDATKVENTKSSAMPTTGGIGTTIFYVVGGVLVIGAVILLITKKRMKDE
ncbi:MAG: LPXTG cell wall anchor domain-containing protein [Ruminococcus sp.]|nr:LPXTG cell wall anchor domain-containing protein [Ruminococcus sp.]